MNRIWQSFRLLLVGLVLMSLGGCQPNVYGSIGMSTWGGHGGGLHGNVSIGGRVCC